MYACSQMGVSLWVEKNHNNSKIWMRYFILSENFSSEFFIKVKWNDSMRYILFRL